MKNDQQYLREGYLLENYHYFHLCDTAGQERDFHFHDFDKIVILLEGNVHYLVENEEYELPPKSLLLVKRHAIHKAVIDRSVPYDRIIVYLDRSFFDHVLPSAPLMSYFEQKSAPGQLLLLPDVKQWQTLSELFRSYEDENSDVFAAQAMRDTLMMQMLILVGRMHPQGAGSSDDKTDPKIHQVLTYIQKNLNAELTVDSLSAQVFLSRYHFMPLFKAQTGQSVHAYIREKRLLCAARMIREGCMAGEAALSCGFKDYSSFHRAFRDSFGINPAQLKTIDKAKVL